MHFLMNGFKAAIHKQMENYYREYFFTKHIDYRDEIEYRFVVISDQEGDLFLTDSKFTAWDRCWYRRPQESI